MTERNPTTLPHRPQVLPDDIASARPAENCDTSGQNPASQDAQPTLAANGVPVADAPVPRTVKRGISTTVSSRLLRDRIWVRALTVVQRFRVIRTIDIALACFPERPFKAALTAAQRAVRGMVKNKLLKRYKTDRFQTTYGLTGRGAAYLSDAGTEATSSVRRVGDMTNPEHRLWTQFLVLAAEARGLEAQTETELLVALNIGRKEGADTIQGLLMVDTERGGAKFKRFLRPDAVWFESEADGARAMTWVEVDRSARGTDRNESLSRSIRAVGYTLPNRAMFRRLVVFCKTDRILARVLAVVRGLVRQTKDVVLTGNNLQLREAETGVFEVWRGILVQSPDGRSRIEDRRQGHVIVQQLPIWLPRVRIDAQNKFPMHGWLDENYLPSVRPASLSPWPRPHSPLM
jgi:hypothetical protein